VVGPFPGHCTSGSYVHWAALYLQCPKVPPFFLDETPKFLLGWLRFYLRATFRVYELYCLIRSLYSETKMKPLIPQPPVNANLYAFVLSFCYCRVSIQVILSSVAYLMVMGHTVILLPKKFEIHFLSSYSHNGKPVLVGTLVLIKMEAFLEVSTLKKRLLLLMMNVLNLLIVMRMKSFLRCFSH
jgi:hypothetical protein